MNQTEADYGANVEWFSGFSGLYEDSRPLPPQAMAELVLASRAGEPLRRVVDLGSGTGTSSRYWSGHADAVIGIEPSDDMRRTAEQTTREANVRYLPGFGDRTGLPDGCAQLVTCFQSLHWMDPLPTFREIGRLTAPGGMFVAADYDWPPFTGSWELDQAWAGCRQQVRELASRMGLKRSLREWNKKKHASRMRDCPCFRSVREVLLHQIEAGGAERYLNALMSQGEVMGLIKRGLPPSALGLDRVQRIAREVLPRCDHPWFWSCRLILARL